MISAAVSARSWTRFLLDQPVPSSWVAGILDRNGTVVARTRAAEKFVGSAAPEWVRSAIQEQAFGWTEGKELDSGGLAMSFARSARSGWTVAFAAPSSLVEAPIRRTLWLVGGTNGVVLLGAALVARAFAGRLSGMLSDLRLTAQAMKRSGAAPVEAMRPGIAEFASLYDCLQDAERAWRDIDHQRDLSMRELQHRVKNDLQALRSLLLIETSQARNPETVGILKLLDGRVEALRLVHERLYDAKAVGIIELGGYLHELCCSTALLYGGTASGGISVVAQVEPVDVSHDQAVALGLIANEFVTNSAKHAFPDGRGMISLAVERGQGDLVRLRLSDDGIGFPAERSRSSGTMLIEMLGRQIGADLNWDSQGGTALSIEFRNQIRVGLPGREASLLT